MLSNDIILSARNISKKYASKKNDPLKKGEDSGGFWALNDVSFDLHKGQVLGIIGTNGAGKSTILKILAEIIAPTSGHVEYKGSILSILDIGTGFHPDLSGYENIFLNASLLGMKKKKIREKVDEIITFSGISDYINQPVKTYSNGMYLRLALSIALFTDNEIILLDEVLSVGDTEFRLKAIRKIKEQSQQGKACIMISHDLGSVLELCDTCLLLEKGKIVYSGSSKAAIDDYYEKVYDSIHLKKTPPPQHPACNITGVELEKESFYMDEQIRLKIKYELKQEEDLRITLKIRTFHGAAMTDSMSYRPDYTATVLKPGYYETTCVIPANLFNAGSYMVDILMSNDLELFTNLELAGRFKVAVKDWEAGKIWNENNEAIPFRPICAWETKPVNL